MPAVEEFEGDAPRFVEVAAADAEFTVDDGGIVEDEVFFGLGGTVLIDKGKGLFAEGFSEFAGVGDGGRAADELGGGAVEFADAAEAAEDVAEVGTVDAAVVVEFVDDEVAEVFKGLGPFGVMGEDAAVEHIGVGEDDVGAFANGATGVGGGVAVVREGLDREAHGVDHFLEFLELVFGEGFGREEVHGSGAGFEDEAVEHREVVAKGFAGGGGSDDDDVASVFDVGEGFGLMPIEFADSAFDEGVGEFRGNGFRDRSYDRIFGELVLNRTDWGVFSLHPLLKTNHRPVKARGAAEGGVGIREA